MQNYADYAANGLGPDMDVPIPADDSNVTLLPSKKPTITSGMPVLTAFGGVVILLVVTYLFFTPVNS